VNALHIKIKLKHNTIALALSATNNQGKSFIIKTEAYNTHRIQGKSLSTKRAYHELMTNV